MRKVLNTRMYEEIAKELGKRTEERQEKFEFDVTQIRNKFKTLTAECKKVSLTIKTATGITKYRDDKGFGSWFDVLYPLVKARDSCNPQNGWDPASEETVTDDNDKDDETDDGGKKAYVQSIREEAEKR